MASQIAWLDSTPEEQKAARELIALFDEQESRDELGIGPIRDAFSDLLFPGTSVLQTRARYFLFVPWCYTSGPAARLTGSAHRERGRGQERELIKALRNSSSRDKVGLIGARVGVNVQNLPSDIYWNGLITYGIREFSGQIGALNETLTELEGATELADRAATEWNRTIPAPPEGFPGEMEQTFGMSQEEAAWLCDRITAATQGTLLAHLLGRGKEIDDDAATPWEVESAEAFEPVTHARLFSSAMHGAALLYNLIIAERFTAKRFESDDDLVKVYTRRVAQWATGVLEPSREEFKGWNLHRMWELVKSSNPNVHPEAERFVTAWIDCLRRDADPLTDTSMRQLVEVRERRKGSQSRMKNDKLLAAWSGASGTGLLSYRWGTVRVIVNDILRGLADAGA